MHAIIVTLKFTILSQRKFWSLQTPYKQVKVIDPSELHRPEAAFAKKALSEFRDYSLDENDPIKERVYQTYLQMHTNQTVDFVKSKFILQLFYGGGTAFFDLQ